MNKLKIIDALPDEHHKANIKASRSKNRNVGQNGTANQNVGQETANVGQQFL
ncbi:hypothetical protein [Sphingobacterium sp. UBA6320]|jgi:hypothetical protein|uniref:hypothetical protein n=1 Tax=Sphingobacterium sp. UBA6320 TaxID=1947510 RepID=UPI0025D68AB2|nr:hypothetical protein [Sphingobacterium sp. UBA6320]